MTANPTLLSMPLAQNGQKNVIPETQATAGDGLFSQSTGFPAETSLPLGAGGVAPSREDFNGMANLLGGVAYYAQKGWIFQFDAGQEYFAGCIVRDTTDGKLYECINDVAAGGSVPSADNVNWQPFSTGGDGVPIGAIIPYSANGKNPAGYLTCDGAAVSRTMYPDLFAVIGTTYGDGDGSTTFNLPDLSDNRFLEGYTAAGTVKSSGLPNITGGISDKTAIVMSPIQGTPFGAFFADDSMPASQRYSSTNSSGYYLINFDASKSNAIYGASNTVQPASLTVRYVIKAFDGQTPDSALIDITQYAQELTNKATKSLDNLTQDGEDHFLGGDNFTIIYPNGGTEASPATVSINSRYVEQNPYSGYLVNCTAEVLFDGNWGSAPFQAEYTTTSGNTNKGVGVACSQINNDQIVIQTGNLCLLSASNVSGDPFNNTTTVNTPLPCRVKVWKIGKQVSA